MKKSTQLKKIIQSDNLEFLMEAHNGLSATIVQEAGFKGIWASGLTMSASLGVRDNNEASWTQVLEILEFMSDKTTIPILLDGDTGYGNFNNMRRLVYKLEQRNIAGVCIEDKLFPKTNSFIESETQPLADIDEFCGKIMAAKDSQKDEDFIVVARVEALIAGWGILEALKRADAYRKAGCDAILIHSKKANASEIEAFMKEWGKRHPVIIVPTKYYSTPTDFFREIGISAVIWANHNLRTATRAMQNTSRQIFLEESLINIEDKIVPVSEIFRLQGADELKEAEKKYLLATGKNVNAIVLAAAQGERLGELTKNTPKALLTVNGKPILATLVEELNQAGIKDIAVVRGFLKEKIALPNVKMIDNDLYAASSELYSLFLASDMIKETTIVCYGDIIFKSYLLSDLLDDNSDIAIVVDADYEIKGDYQDLVKTDRPYSKKEFNRSAKLEKIRPDLPRNEVNGEFIGLFKASRAGAQAVKEGLLTLSKSKDFLKLRMADLFNEIIKERQVAVRFIRGSWLDIDTIVDLQKANELS